MIGNSRTITVVAAAWLILAVSSQSSFAQESKTVDGLRLGNSTWQVIPLGDSDLRDSTLPTFTISKKKLSGRVQESWNDQRNVKDGPLVSMFYERLLTRYFADMSFDTDFRRVLNSTFKQRGASLENLEFERISRAFKAAFVSYGNTSCIAMLRIMGRSSNDIADFSGDLSARVFVCDQNPTDREMLKRTALSFFSELKRDGRRVRVPGGAATSYETASARLFGNSTKPDTNTTSEIKIGWQTRPIALRWQGVSELIAGEISFSENNRSGILKSMLPGNRGTCEGTYSLSAGSSGSWAIACTNNLTASGTFTGFGSGKGSSGKGTDNRGNAIEFTMGGN